MRQTKRVLLLFMAVVAMLPMAAQKSSFRQFQEQQNAKFNQFKSDQQAKYDAFRKRVNEEYAQFMRQAWGEQEEHEADTAVTEKIVPPYIYEENGVSADSDTNTIVEQTEDLVAEQAEQAEQAEDSVKEEVIIHEKIWPLPIPKSPLATQPMQIPTRPSVTVLPQPEPVPEPIAPVAPKTIACKRVSIAYFGTIVTIPFPEQDKLKISSLNENGIADAWLTLSDSIYDNTIKAALDIRKAYALCDWAYMNMLREVTEKQYGKSNEAVLAQAFIMAQSGYRIRLGRNDTKLYLLSASQYDIFDLRYYMIDGSKFYIVNGERNAKMYICEAKFGKEKPLSLQITKLPKLGEEQTPKRTMSSRKGVTTAACVNKNLIDFFNQYPQACFKGDQTTRWVAYANTPIEKSVTDMLYPPLRNAIQGLGQKEAVSLLLNWVQTAFAYEYDEKVWGGDRAFFAQETLFYPYCDCEDRSILFSRIVRDLTGLDVVFLYYPGHLATAVGFTDEVNGDWVIYNGKKYVVCDPTYINAGVGRTMPGMNNQAAQIVALK